MSDSTNELGTSTTAPATRATASTGRATPGAGCGQTRLSGIRAQELGVRDPVGPDDVEVAGHIGSLERLREVVDGVGHRDRLDDRPAHPRRDRLHDRQPLGQLAHHLSSSTRRR